ncbi:DUF6336 family protein [Streptomyces sp. enrichment culture]|uniref:DUF6336 family protein n=1 Tax=Streptomyces sp. enrichment culture TaxID=1795815 RepID=UPI003F54F2DB
MERDDDGVLVPRMRLGNVLLRGLVYGAGGAVLSAVGMLFFGDHSDRMDYLVAVAALSLVVGGELVIGLFFWAMCAGDIRRIRDWRTIRGQFDSVNVAAPVLVRLGAFGLVVLAASYGLYHVVDDAPFDSWLYGD